MKYEKTFGSNTTEYCTLAQRVKLIHPWHNSKLHMANTECKLKLGLQLLLEMSIMAELKMNK